MSDSTQNFTELLDSCIEAVVNGRLTITQCLDQYPEHRDELADLLPLLTKLQTGQQVTPAPAFRQAARQRLLSKLEPATPVATAAVPVAPTPSLWTRLQSWWAKSGWANKTVVAPRPALAWSLALVLILFFFIGGGTFYAANQSLPGDTLYPLNQTVEQWRVDLARDEQSRFELQLAFADKRLHEAARLARRGDLAHMEEALAGYQALLTSATQAVETADSTQQPLLASRLETATTSHDDTLNRLFMAISTTADPQPAAGEAITAVFCQPDSDLIHPAASQLANQHDVAYETIVAWFCQGFGFGEIGLAYNLSEQTDTAVANLFALRSAGYGWGQIMQAYEDLLPLLPDPDQPGNGTTPQPTPGPPVDHPGGPPDPVNPPGLGPPDNIEPPRRTPAPPTPPQPDLPLPPGQGGSPPGQGDGPPPGQGGSPPGQGDGPPPGQGGSPPGQGDNPPPGQGGSPPGQGSGPP